MIVSLEVIGKVTTVGSTENLYIATEWLLVWGGWQGNRTISSTEKLYIIVKWLLVWR